jgi:hypothetical protein
VGPTRKSRARLSDCMHSCAEDTSRVCVEVGALSCGPQAATKASAPGRARRRLGAGLGERAARTRARDQGGPRVRLLGRGGGSTAARRKGPAGKRALGRWCCWWAAGRWRCAG